MPRISLTPTVNKILYFSLTRWLTGGLLNLTTATYNMPSGGPWQSHQCIENGWLFLGNRLFELSQYVGGVDEFHQSPPRGPIL